MSKNFGFPSRSDFNRAIHLGLNAEGLGKPIDVTVYKGVVWEDENESPIDRRLYGHISLNEIKAGQTVIFDSNELLAATSEQLAKLDLAYRPFG